MSQPVTLHARTEYVPPDCKSSPRYRPGEEDAIAAYLAKRDAKKLKMGESAGEVNPLRKKKYADAVARATALRNGSMREAGLREGEKFYRRMCELVGHSPRPAHRAAAITRIAEENGVPRDKVNTRIYEYRKSGRCPTFSNGDFGV